MLTRARGRYGRQPANGIQPWVVYWIEGRTETFDLPTWSASALGEPVDGHLGGGVGVVRLEPRWALAGRRLWFNQHVINETYSFNLRRSMTHRTVRHACRSSGSDDRKLTVVVLK